MRKAIAVVGAGIAGLTCARHLLQAHHTVTLFDKGTTAIGGRLASRDTALGPMDYGAVYITARDDRFWQLVDEAIQQGILAEWPATAAHRQADGQYTLVHEGMRLAGVPHLAQFAQWLAEGLTIKRAQRIQSLHRQGQRWLMTVENLSEHHQYTAGPFDAVVLALPLPQALALYPQMFVLHPSIEQVKYAARWVGIFGVHPLPTLDHAIISVDDEILMTGYHEGSKPGRDDAGTLIVHAQHAWSEKNEWLPVAMAAKKLWAKTRECIWTNLPEQPHFVDARFWRYSGVMQPLGKSHLWDMNERVGMCGDWSGDQGTESAFISGLEMAKELINALSDSETQ